MNNDLTAMLDSVAPKPKGRVPKPKGRAPKYHLHELLVSTAEGRKTEGPIFTAHALALALKVYCKKNNLNPEDLFKFVMAPKPWEHDSFKEMCDTFNIMPVEE